MMTQKQIVKTVNRLKMTAEEKKALIKQCEDKNPSALFVVNAKRKQLAASGSV
jgi:hypothetical protein